MKTLINKNNPALRITATEVETLYDKSRCVKYYYVKDLRLGVLQENWALVEEEPEKVNCPFDKGDCRYCTVQFCGAREEKHIETRSTAEPVDLEKTVEFECIGKKVKMTVQELIDYYIDSECVDVADECGF